LVFGTSLANILNNDESWQTDAFAIEQVLVDTARVAANTSLLQIIIIVSFFAFGADSVDGIETLCAIAVAGGGIEYFVDTAPIAFRMVATLYLYCRSAVEAVL